MRLKKTYAAPHLAARALHAEGLMAASIPKKTPSPKPTIIRTRPASAAAFDPFSDLWDEW